MSTDGQQWVQRPHSPSSLQMQKKQISLISFLIIKLFMVSLLLLLAYSEILSLLKRSVERGRGRNRILKENMHPMQASRI